jgi:glycerophosphoryl diester phosphodiesterase
MAPAITIWGHRGCRGSRNPPENSLRAFQSALEQGADGIELDVFLTEDDHLVVFHDDTLERMTNGRGNITSYSLAELREFRLKDANGEPTGSCIPTLDEVLETVDRFRNQHLTDDRVRSFVVNIEIKEMKGKNIASAVAAAIDKRLAQGWQPSNFQVSSFDIQSLRQMKRTKPNAPLGALFEGPEEPWDIDESDLANRLTTIRDLQPQTINITLPSLTPQAVRLIRDAGALPVAWTCNERMPDDLAIDERRAIARRLIEHRISTIITDYPDQMRRLLLTAAQRLKVK